MGIGDYNPNTDPLSTSPDYETFADSAAAIAFGNLKDNGPTGNYPRAVIVYSGSLEVTKPNGDADIWEDPGGTFVWPLQLATITGGTALKFKVLW